LVVVPPFGEALRKEPKMVLLAKRLEFKESEERKGKEFTAGRKSGDILPAGELAIRQEEKPVKEGTWGRNGDNPITETATIYGEPDKNHRERFRAVVG